MTVSIFGFLWHLSLLERAWTMPRPPGVNELLAEPMLPGVPGRLTEGQVSGVLSSDHLENPYLLMVRVSSQRPGTRRQPSTDPCVPGKRESSTQGPFGFQHFGICFVCLCFCVDVRLPLLVGQAFQILGSTDRSTELAKNH